MCRQRYGGCVAGVARDKCHGVLTGCDVQAALLESQAPVHALAGDPGMPMGMGP